MTPEKEILLNIIKVQGFCENHNDCIHCPLLDWCYDISPHNNNNTLYVDKAAMAEQRYNLAVTCYLRHYPKEDLVEMLL